MSEQLPPQLNYSQLNSLPGNTVNTSMVIAPSNGSGFLPGSVIYFDLPASGYMDGSTLYMRYTFNCLATVANSFIRGCPAAAPFSRLELTAGSNTIENIPYYNVLYNLMSKVKLNAAQKAASPHLGYIDSLPAASGTAPTLVNCNGRIITYNAAAQSMTFAFPVLCSLSQAEKLIPLGMMNAIRFAFTLDATANYMYQAATGVLAGVSLSGCELCYDICQFGPDVDQQIRSTSQMINIKSRGFGLQSQPISTGFVGNTSLTYQMRYSSIISLFALLTPSRGGLTFDSADICSGSGNYQFSVNGTQYPNRALDAAQKSGVYQELMLAVGALHNANANMSITAGEWNSTDATAAGTYATPQYFAIGVNTEKLSSATSLLSGISSREAPVIFTVNCNSATNYGYTVICVAMHDKIIQVDTQLKQVNMIV